MGDPNIVNVSLRLPAETWGRLMTASANNPGPLIVDILGAWVPPTEPATPEVVALGDELTVGDGTSAEVVSPNLAPALPRKRRG